MKFKELQEVVLTRDLPEHGLRRGDVGVVVYVYPPGGLEVEFLTAAGRTLAVVTLDDSDARPPGDDDILSARPLDRPA